MEYEKENPTSKQMKNGNRLINTESRQVLPESRGGWRMGKTDKGDQEVQTSGYEISK